MTKLRLGTRKRRRARCGRSARDLRAVEGDKREEKCKCKRLSVPPPPRGAPCALRSASRSSQLQHQPPSLSACLPSCLGVDLAARSPATQCLGASSDDHTPPRPRRSSAAWSQSCASSGLLDQTVDRGRIGACRSNGDGGLPRKRPRTTTERSVSPGRNTGCDCSEVAVEGR